MTNVFTDPVNQKHCWSSERIDFKKYGLSWDEACGSLWKEASYDDNKGDTRYTRYVDTPSHSILGYVRNRSAVCEGFARTCQAFMNYAGITAVSVSGMLFQDEEERQKSGRHARNFICLSDEKRWIMVDVTQGVWSGGDGGFDIPPSPRRYRRLRPDEMVDEHSVYMPRFDDIWEQSFLKMRTHINHPRYDRF